MISPLGFHVLNSKKIKKIKLWLSIWLGIIIEWVDGAKLIRTSSIMQEKETLKEKCYILIKKT